jgi:shikimate kinase
MPNCGKSTLGRQAAERLHMTFFDTDIMTKDKLGEIKLLDTFSPHFHMRFIEEQRKAIIELAGLDVSAIISTGAEIALIPECVEYMQKMGFIIYIKWEMETILEGLKKDVKDRPVLVNVKDGTILDMEEKAVKAYSEHLSQYEETADFMLDNNGSEDEGVEKLITLIQAIDKAPSKSITPRKKQSPV